MTSANISISSIATGMWAYGISLFQNSTQWIEKKNNICIWLLQPQRKKASCKKGNAHPEETLLLLHLHLFVFLSVTTSANLSMNSQRGKARGGARRRRSASSSRSDGGRRTSCHSARPLNGAVASNVRGDGEAWRTRLAAAGLNITGCDLKYPAEIHFEVRGVTVFLLEPLPPHCLRRR